MSKKLTVDALRLYAPPFRYEHGFIWDANNNVVADDHGQDIALRIRGWGRIGYLPNAERLQDEVGRLIAEAMTEFWQREWRAVLADPAAWDIAPDDIDALLRHSERGRP